jgi:hypothetical protein
MWIVAWDVNSACSHALAEQAKAVSVSRVLVFDLREECAKALSLSFAVRAKTRHVQPSARPGH